MNIKPIEEFTLEECRAYLQENPAGELAKEVQSRLLWLLSEADKRAEEKRRSEEQEAIDSNPPTDRTLQPRFISKEELLKRNPEYVAQSKYSWGRFAISMLVCSLINAGGTLAITLNENDGAGFLFMFTFFFFSFLVSMAIGASFLALDFYDVEDTDRELRIVRASTQKYAVYQFSKKKISRRLTFQESLDHIVYWGEGTFLVQEGEKLGLVNMLDPNPNTNSWIQPLSRCTILREQDHVVIEADGKVKKMTLRGFKLNE